MAKSQSTASRLRDRHWRRDNHLISTDASLIPIPEVIKMFGLKEFYWAKPVPEDVMIETLQNSLCFGLFRDNNSSEGRDFLGLARCITDFTTFVYLTDVWVDPQEQGKGLGTWLIQCVQEVIEEMPHLRRSLLFTSSWERSVPFYERFMGMEVLECEKGKGVAIMGSKGRGHSSFTEKETSHGA